LRFVVPLAPQRAATENEAKPAVTSVIIGAKRPDQLQDNVAAMELTLTQDEIKQLDEVSALVREGSGA